MRCLSCKEEYEEEDAGRCNECYKMSRKTAEEIRNEIEELKLKVAFLRVHQKTSSDIVLLQPAASDAVSVEGSTPASDAAVTVEGSTPAVPVHRVILVSRSYIFEAMLKNNKEEGQSTVIKIPNVSYDTLRCFVHYLYTAEMFGQLDYLLASNLLILAKEYKVEHLKAFCEKFMSEADYNTSRT